MFDARLQNISGSSAKISITSAAAPAPPLLTQFLLGLSESLLPLLLLLGRLEGHVDRLQAVTAEEGHQISQLTVIYVRIVLYS